MLNILQAPQRKQKQKGHDDKDVSILFMSRTRPKENRPNSKNKQHLILL